MPGLFGFCGLDGESGRDLDAMGVLIRHEGYQRITTFPIDGGVLGYTSGKPPTEANATEQNDVRCLFYGEILNRDRLSLSGGASSEAVLNAYLAGNLDDVIKLADGWFGFVIHDRRSKRLLLGGDRLGFWPLYTWTNGKVFAWCNEPKGFLATPGFRPTFHVGAAEELIAKEWVSAGATLFTDVEAARPGALLEIDLNAPGRIPSVRRVWTHTMIKPLDDSVKDAELVEELGRLFRAAAARYVPVGPYQPIVFLSGGLDSRCTLAAIPPQDRPIPCFTFGQRNAADIVIAAHVAKVKGAEHHVEYLDPAAHAATWNDIVWRVDGASAIYHNNGLALAPFLIDHPYVHITGFLGDALIGGGYGDRGQGSEWDLLFDRGRRLIAVSVHEGSNIVAQRHPFVERDFFDFSMAIPHARRSQSALYNAMLLREFPEFYRTIPWQRTFCPITASQTAMNLAHRRIQVKSLLHRKFGLGTSNTTIPSASLSRQVWRSHYRAIDWQGMILAEPMLRAASELADPKTAMLPDFLPNANLKNELSLLQGGGRNWAKALTYVTLEIWLRQNIKGERRPIVGQG